MNRVYSGYFPPNAADEVGFKFPIIAASAQIPALEPQLDGDFDPENPTGKRGWFASHRVHRRGLLARLLASPATPPPTPQISTTATVVPTQRPGAWCER